MSVSSVGFSLVGNSTQYTHEYTTLSSTYSIVNRLSYLSFCTPTQCYFCKASDRIFAECFALMGFFEECVVDEWCKYGKEREEGSAQIESVSFLFLEKVKG